MKNNFNWCVVYLPGTNEGSTPEYFKTEKEAISYWEKMARSCSICGKGNWCDAMSVEWTYFKVDADDIIEIRKRDLINLLNYHK